MVFTAMAARADRDRFQSMVALKMVEVDSRLKQQYEDPGGGAGRPPSSSSLNFGSSTFGKSGFGDRLAPAAQEVSSPRRGYRPAEELGVGGGGGDDDDDRGRAPSFAATGSTDIEMSRSMTTTGIHLGERVVVADPASADQAGEGTALSGSIFTVLTGLSWICVGIHSRRALPSPVCA